MGLYDDLKDIQIDLATGAPVINSATNDAVIISGVQVILQDAAIRLRTQRGQVQRQGLDNFGWELCQKIKADVDLGDLADISQEMERVILEDTRIQDCKVVPGELKQDGTVEYTVTCQIDDRVVSGAAITI